MMDLPTPPIDNTPGRGSLYFLWCFPGHRDDVAGQTIDYVSPFHKKSRWFWSKPNRMCRYRIIILPITKRTAKVFQEFKLS
jgi:hypothetical protein